MAATVEDVLIGLGFQLNEASKRNAAAQINNLKSMATKALGAVGLTVSVVAVKQFADDCVKVASDAQQMKSKFEAVFGGMSDAYQQFAENYADEVGRSKLKIMEYLADTQNLVAGFMITDITNEEQTARERAQAAEMSEAIMELSMNLASFANMNEDQAIDSTTKAIMGQAQAAKTMGTVLNDDTKQAAMLKHQQDLLAKGIDVTTTKYKNLTQAQKMWVNYYAMVDQSPDAMNQIDEITGKAVGSARAERNSFESQQRRMKALNQEMKATIGEFLLPFMSKGVAFGGNMVSSITKLVKKLGDFKDESSKAAKILKGYSAVFEIIEKVAGGIGTAITNFTERLKIVDHVANVFERISNFITDLQPAFGTLGEIIELLLISWQEFMAGIDSTAVVDLMKNIGLDPDQVRETIQTIEGLFGSFFDNLAKLFDGEISFSDFGQAIVNSLNEIDFAQLGSNILEIFRTIFAQLPKELKTVMGVGLGASLVTGLFRSLPGILGFFNIINTLFSGIPALGSGVIGTIAATFKGIGGLLIGVIAGPIKLVGGLFGALTGNVSLATGAAKVLAGAFNVVKFLGIAGAIAAIITAIVDLTSFMTGGYSIIGGIIEKFGGDSDGLRETVSTAIESIKTSFGNLKETVFDGLGKLWEVYGPMVMGVLTVIYSTAVGVIVGILNAIGPFLDTISGLVTFVVDLFTGNWGSLAEDIGNIFGSILNVVMSFGAAIIDVFESIFGFDLSKMFDGLKEKFDESWVGQQLNSLTGLLTGNKESDNKPKTTGPNTGKDPNSHEIPVVDTSVDYRDIMAQALIKPADRDTSIYDAGNRRRSSNQNSKQNSSLPQPPAGNPFISADDAKAKVDEQAKYLEQTLADFEAAAENTTNDLSATWTQATSDASSQWGETADAAQSAFEPFPEYLAGLPDDFYMYGNEAAHNFANGVYDAIPEVSNAARFMAEQAADPVHHSVPKVGPLKNDDKWGGEFVDNIVNGIRSRIPSVRSAVMNVANALGGTQAQALAGAGVPSLAMAGVGGSYVVNQYITFSNSFTGTDRQNQQTAATQMNKNARDATTYMANAMSYGR